MNNKEFRKSMKENIKQGKNEKSKGVFKQMEQINYYMKTQLETKKLEFLKDRTKIIAYSQK